MPIATLEDNHIDQRCALCGDVHRVMHTQLKGGDDPNVIAVPPCPKCGACEFLIRSPAEGSDADDPTSHRALVGRLHAALTSEKALLRRTGDSAPLLKS